MKLPFDNLISFHAVVSFGSFSNGARKLGKSQSTVSGAIKNLENELDYALIDRSKSTLTLTDKGKKIYHLSAPIISKYFELLQIAESLHNSDTKKINIGIDPLIFNEEVKQVLIEFSETFPDTELTVFTKPSHILGQYVNCHKVDIAIGNPYHKTELSFNIDELFMVNCSWVIHKDVSTDYDLSSMRLLLIDGSESFVDFSSIAKHNIWILDDTSTILDLCLAKKGIAFLPHHLIDNHSRRFELMTFSDEMNLFGKQIYASLFWPTHSDFTRQHQWIHNKLRKGRQTQ
ncbi:LysR family transcriptional regulator [Vibrio sp. ZSDZ65]|uniref:LysR family transcriptional regulator n=1 Tax=Vibrio qingdaonensis TaxID=2829491 RepID=A0A9X3CJN1_9VIBR|nr:LysR family transcriptional regulator [Vibrio qingdaonensis]MCW8344521.1 LysR family transcriptional regulator [Vibrio qingdaonensis]